MQKALDDQCIPYDVVPGPLRPKNSTAVIVGTGQPLYPAIQFEDGSWYREESKEMARTISERRLMAMSLQDAGVKEQPQVTASPSRS